MINAAGPSECGDVEATKRENKNEIEEKFTIRGRRRRRARNEH